MAPLKRVRKRAKKWLWRKIVACCCTLESLDDWESTNSVDWEERRMSPGQSLKHGEKFGHLVSLENMLTWQERGDFVRALRHEDLLAVGSMLHSHPILRICLGFKDCELSTGKDYSCYCRAREIFRGRKMDDANDIKYLIECEPLYDGIVARDWVNCVQSLMCGLWNLSSLRHKRTNFSVKKHITNDVLMSDPIHLMYVHIEGMIPQFGPFMFEVWRRNQGLQVGLTGDSLNHGVQLVISNPRRQSVEVELRQMFPNKSLKLRKYCTGQNMKRGKGPSVIGASASSVFISSVSPSHVPALLTGKSGYPPMFTASFTNSNHSATPKSTKNHGPSVDVDQFLEVLTETEYKTR